MERTNEKEDDGAFLLMSDIDKVIHPLVKQIQKMTKHIQLISQNLRTPEFGLTNIEPPDFSLASSILKGIASPGFLKEFERMNDPEFEMFIKEFDWMGPLSLAALFACYDRYKPDENLEAAWDELKAVFRRLDMLNDVEKLFRQSRIPRNRLDILTKGLEHHKNRDYVSSVSVLLPQAEGLVWDIGVAKGIVDPLYNSRVKLVSGKPVLGKKGKPVQWTSAAIAGEIWGFSDRSHKAFNRKYGGEIYSKDFRHPILHGRDTSKFTEKDSLTVIMCLMCIGEMAGKYLP